MEQLAERVDEEGLNVRERLLERRPDDRDDWKEARKITRVILRIEHLINHFFPVEIPEEEISSPTSWVITSDVLDAFAKVAQEDEGGLWVVPYALLCARMRFIYASKTYPADYEEAMLRRTACSVLATRL